MDCEGMMRFIIENELTDRVIIILHPEVFDALAIDYISTHGYISRPFELLGIEIYEDTTGKVARNRINIVEKDNPA